MENQSTKIRVVAVSYLNTKPMTYAFEHGAMADQMELSFMYPSLLADELISGRADVGLVPVATIPTIPNARIISDFCIGTEGEVASVCLFSHVPLEEVKSLVLDYQSRTSVALTKILLKHHWNITPELISASAGYENEVNVNQAALIIGDRALQCRNQYKYVYDLGVAWKAMTGLPFVFAAWVSNQELNTDFLTSFNEHLKESMGHLDEIIASIDFPEYPLLKYYQENISYSLDEEKRKGMALFLGYLNT